MDTTNKLAEALERARAARTALESGSGMVRALDNLFEAVSNTAVLDALIAGLSAKSDAAQATQAVSEPVATQPAEPNARLRRYKDERGNEHWEFVGNRYPFFDLPHGEYALYTHPAPASASEPQAVEAWHGNRKVTIYAGDEVLRIAAMNDITGEPHTLDTAQAAFDWLYGVSASVAGAGEARLRELLEQSEACLSAKIQIGQVFPDEPPMPLDEWSYGADQIAHAIRHELQICYPDECKTVSECNSMGCRIEREKEGQRP